MVERLVDHYAGQAPGGRTIRRLFWYAAIQRLAQALGAFGRLSENPETAEFARHIPAALKRMREAVERVEGLPHLRAWLRRYASRGRRVVVGRRSWQPVSN
jgi:aminoglycoside/choline kinase family phosphotransferase